MPPLSRANYGVITFQGSAVANQPVYFFAQEIDGDWVLVGSTTSLQIPFSAFGAQAGTFAISVYLPVDTYVASSNTLAIP